MAVFLVLAVLQSGYNQRKAAPPTCGVSMSRYRLKSAIPAILDKFGGEKIPVTLPSGALLRDSSEPSTTLLGMIGVYWEGRHYSVYLNDLVMKAEYVSTA